jgi:hypothetical protein
MRLLSLLEEVAATFSSMKKEEKTSLNHRHVFTTQHGIASQTGISELVTFSRSDIAEVSSILVSCSFRVAVLLRQNIYMFWRKSANLFERTTNFGNVFDMVANEPRNSAGIVTSLRGGRPINRDLMSDRDNKVPPLPTSRLAVELTELSTKGVKNERKVALTRPLKA